MKLEVQRKDAAILEAARGYLWSIFVIMVPAPADLLTCLQVGATIRTYPVFDLDLEAEQHVSPYHAMASGHLALGAWRKWLRRQGVRQHHGGTYTGKFVSLLVLACRFSSTVLAIVVSSWGKPQNDLMQLVLCICCLLAAANPLPRYGRGCSGCSVLVVLFVTVFASGSNSQAPQARVCRCLDLAYTSGQMAGFSCKLPNIDPRKCSKPALRGHAAAASTPNVHSAQLLR